MLRLELRPAGYQGGKNRRYGCDIDMDVCGYGRRLCVMGKLWPYATGMADHPHQRILFLAIRIHIDPKATGLIPSFTAFSGNDLRRVET